MLGHSSPQAPDWAQCSVCAQWRDPYEDFCPQCESDRKRVERDREASVRLDAFMRRR